MPKKQEVQTAMDEKIQVNENTNGMAMWNGWFDSPLRTWANLAGVAAEYCENYIDFANNLQHTNQEYLMQLRAGAHPLESIPVTPAQAAQLAPLPPVGARAERTHTITRAEIANFAELSGDFNPIHLDPIEAAKSPFGERIAHGLLVGSLVSCVLGNDLPGPGTIYLGQTFKFLAPAHIGDVITTSAEVIAVREDKRLLTLRTECTNQAGTVVLTGEATVKYIRLA
jgi:3-hydroxybutyryl-CoA dehydratase